MKHNLNTVLLLLTVIISLTQQKKTYSQYEQCYESKCETKFENWFNDLPIRE